MEKASVFVGFENGIGYVEAFYLKIDRHSILEKIMSLLSRSCWFQAPTVAWLCLLCANLVVVGLNAQEKNTGDQTPFVPGTAIVGEQEIDNLTVQAYWRAARNGDLAKVKAALENGIEIDAKTEYGATALFFACDREQVEVVKFLLAKGADPNIRDTFYKATPVTWAQMKGNQEIILSLINFGGEGVDAILYGAVTGDDVDYAGKLLKSGKATEKGMLKARDAAKKADKPEMVALFDGYDLPDVPKIELSQELLESYSGEYKGERFNLTVSTNQGQLLLAFNGGEPTELVPSSTTEFSLGTNDVVFDSSDGKVEKLKIKLGDQEMEWVPVETGEGAPDESEKSEMSDRAKSEGTGEKADAENADAAAPEKVKTPKFGPSSKASIAADLELSSPNWPGFRGVGGRGVAEGQDPPTRWSLPKSEPESTGDDAAGAVQSEDQGEVAGAPSNAETDATVIWKSEVPGLGLSCPVIWGNRIYVTTAVSEEDSGGLKIGLYGDVDSIEDESEYEFKLLCFNRKSGELIWEQTAHKAKPAVKRHAKSSHANPTAATNGKYVVAFFGSEGLYCYNRKGKLVWSKSFGVLDSGWFYDPGYQWGFASSPVIHGDNVIVQCDIQDQSFVAALDLKTGEEVWRTEREEIPSWSTPTVHQFGEMEMLITCGTKAARGYDVKDGTLLWTLNGHSEIVVPTPNVAHGLIYVSSGYAPIQPIYAIRPESRGDISLAGSSQTSEHVAWSVKRGGPYMPSPVIYGDYLYCCANNGILSCYAAESGELVYKKRMKAKGGALSFTASPLAADGHLFMTAEDGRVLVVKAGPKFELVETNELGESVLATPAISRGVIYFRTQSHLMAVGQKTTDDLNSKSNDSDNGNEKKGDSN